MESQIANQSPILSYYLTNECLLFLENFHIRYSNPRNIKKHVSRNAKRKFRSPYARNHEKAGKIAEVTVKYNAEINAMEDSGMMAMLIAQMKSNMKQEINDISKEYNENVKLKSKSLEKTIYQTEAIQ